MQGMSFVTMAGLAMALALQVLLHGASRWAAPAARPLAYACAFLAMASALTVTSAWGGMAWAGTVLGLLTVVGMAGWWRHPPARPRRVGIVSMVCLGLLAVELVYGALPMSRYDQWIYHLLVAKQVALQGGVRPPLMNDHIGFAGSYEYLLLLPRLFTADDLIVQTFADATTPLTVLALLAGTAVTLARAWGMTAFPWGPAVLAFWFALPEQEAIMNAKPDAILMGMAALVLASALVAWRSRIAWAAMGTIVVGCVALKLTALHAAVALAPCLALATRRDGVPRGAAWQGLMMGGAAGMVLALPQSFKNARLFANPFHPFQFGPFRSSSWPDTLARYWETIGGKAHGMSAVLSAWLRMPGVVMGHALWIMPALAWLAWRACRSPAVRNRAGVGMALAACAVYMAAWPFLFRPDIFPRFVFPLFAWLFPLWVLALGEARPRPWLFALLCLVPVAGNSGLDVKLRRFAKSRGLTADEFFAEKRPWDLWLSQNAINADRRAHGWQGWDEARVLSDDPAAYFLDVGMAYVRGYDFERLARMVDPATFCPWRVLKAYDIRYVHSYRAPVLMWGRPFRDVAFAGQTLPGHPEIRRLDPDERDRRAAGEICFPYRSVRFFTRPD